MSVSFVAAGAASADGGSGSPQTATPALPTGWAAEDLLVCPVYFKDYQSTVATPSGWTSRQGKDTNGTSSAGGDSGGTGMYLFDREAQSGDGAPSLNLTPFDSGNASNVVQAHIMGYRKASGTTWGLATCGVFTTSSGGTTLDWVAGTDPGFETGDWLVVSSCSASDSGTITLNSVAIPGCTLGTPVQRANESTGQGGDGRLATWDVPITAGSSSGPATVQIAYSTLRNPTVVGMRMREVAAPGGEDLGSVIISGAKKAVATRSVIIGGTKKTVTSLSVIVGGNKKAVG